MKTKQAGHGDQPLAHVRIHEVLALTRLWLDIDAPGPPAAGPARTPAELLQLLETGRCVQWQGWHIKPTPPRRVVLADGSAQWLSGIAALSPRGFVSGQRIDLHWVSQVCERILAIERRIAAQDSLERRDAATLAREREDL